MSKTKMENRGQLENISGSLHCEARKKRLKILGCITFFSAGLALPVTGPIMAIDGYKLIKELRDKNDEASEGSLFSIT